MRAHSYVRHTLGLLVLLAMPAAGWAQEETAAGDAPAAAATPVPASLAAPVAPVATVPAAVIRSSGGGALSSGESDYVLVIGDVVELNIFREPDITT